MKRINKLLLTTVLSGGIGLWGAAALAADEGLSHSDKAFLKDAAEINLGEIKEGEAAQQKAVGSEAKMMAEHIIKDHQEAQADLEKLAQSKSVELPKEPSLTQKASLALLEKKEGEKFDKDFLDSQLKGHKKAIALFEKTAKESKDADIKAYAEKMLPGLKSHLAMAEKSTPAAVGEAPMKHANRTHKSNQ